MGIYDEYGSRRVQMKCRQGGYVQMDHFVVGQEVPLTDGIFVGVEGFIVVKDGVFIAEFPLLYDKRGGVIVPRDALHAPKYDPD